MTTRLKPIVSSGGAGSGGGYDEDGHWVSQRDLDTQDVQDKSGRINKAGQDSKDNAGPNASQGEKERGARDAENKQRGAEGVGDNGHVAYNPGSADVGGHPGGGQEIHDAALAGMHRGDPAYDANQSAMNGSIANMKQDRGVMSPENSTLLGREADTRGQQIDSLGLDRKAAEGNAPSAAAFQTRGDMNNVMAGSAGALGGARGLGALNGGQVLGASTGANAAGSAAFNGGMGRSQEIGSALGMYGSNASNVRGGDLNRLEQSSKNSMFNSDLNNNWKTSNANLAAKQGELGNEQEKMRGAWYDASTEPAQRQAGYDQTMLGMQHGQNAAEASAAVAKSRSDQDRQRAMVGQAGTSGLTLLGTAFGGPAGGAAGGIAGSQINNSIGDKYKNF